MRQPITNKRCGRSDKSCVDFRDRYLFVTRIHFLDNLLQFPAIITDDAPVPSRVRQYACQQRKPPRFSGLDQTNERLRLDQGHIPIYHQNISGWINRRHDLGDRMPGAQLRLLLHPVDIVAQRHPAHGVPAVTIDHVNSRWSSPPHSTKHVIQQGSPTQHLQYLGFIRAHSRAFTSSKNNDFRFFHAEIVRQPVTLRAIFGVRIETTNIVGSKSRGRTRRRL